MSAPAKARAPSDDTLSDRLGKLCGLLGSAHDGERAAAALKADQLLRQHGLRWTDVIHVPEILPTPANSCIWDEPETISTRTAAYLVAYWSDALTDWESKFCRVVSEQPSVSRKQRVILNELVDKCRVFASARS
jgi:hypothetical protein